MNFFHSVPFGIVAMVTVGSSWSLVGLVMGKAPKLNIDPSLVQLFGALFSVAVCLIVTMFCGAPDCAWYVSFLTCATYFVGGALNFILLQYMSDAMQRGPNGVIWSFIQSSLIFPFLGGLLFHGMKANAIQWFGLLLIIIALSFFAVGRQNKRGKGNWLKPTFIAFLLCGINGNVMTEPSYYESALAVNSIWRTLANTGGILVTALAYNCYQITPQKKQLILKTLKRWELWKFVGALQFFSLIFAYTLMYPGMNALAEHKLGGLCYPLMIGSCIFSFALCSIFLLKEQVKASQCFALVCCIAGLIGICWQ